MRTAWTGGLVAVAALAGAMHFMPGVTGTESAIDEGATSAERVVVAASPTVSRPAPATLPGKPERSSAVPTAPRAALASPPNADTTPAVAPELVVTASSLRLRAGASIQSAQLGSLPQGSRLTPLGQTIGSWIKVRDVTSGQEGWVSSRYVETPDQEAAPTRSGAAQPRTAGRAEPSTPMTSTKPVEPTMSDSRIRELVIRDSLMRYPGNCPCPYSLDRAGRRCGGRSAYTRPGGHAPLCYDEDVTAAMIVTWRTQQRR